MKPLYRYSLEEREEGIPIEICDPDTSFYFHPCLPIGISELPDDLAQALTTGQMSDDEAYIRLVRRFIQLRKERNMKYLFIYSADNDIYGKPLRLEMCLDSVEAQEVKPQGSTTGKARVPEDIEKRLNLPVLDAEALSHTEALAILIRRWSYSWRVENGGNPPPVCEES
jgi:hypothetical protein